MITKALMGGAVCGLLSLLAIAVAAYTHPVWWNSPPGLVTSGVGGVVATLAGIWFFGRLDG